MGEREKGLAAGREAFGDHDREFSNRMPDTEVLIAHRLGYWWGTCDDVEDLTVEEIAEADGYFEAWLNWKVGGGHGRA